MARPQIAGRRRASAKHFTPEPRRGSIWACQCAQAKSLFRFQWTRIRTNPLSMMALSQVKYAMHSFFIVHATTHHELRGGRTSRTSPRAHPPSGALTSQVSIRIGAQAPRGRAITALACHQDLRSPPPRTANVAQAFWTTMSASRRSSVLRLCKVVRPLLFSASQV